MNELGMKRLEEFADRFGLGRTTVYSLALGRISAKGTPIKPSIDTLVKLATALNVPLHTLIYELEPDARGVDEPEATPPPMTSVPCDVAGWITTQPDRDEPHPKAAVWVEQSFASGKDLRAYLIRGDSMNGGSSPIKHGDIVLVDRLDKGSNNTPVVARLVGGYVCKLLKTDDYNHIVRLVSANPEHLNGTPTAVTLEEVLEVVGRVIRVIHDTSPSSDK